jgi:fructose-1,6-bisphosphatase/sedoheptulose 1,7-bisphosphatase-like protein
VVSLEMTVEQEHRCVGGGQGRRVDDLTVVVLDRPRHAELIGRIRATGRASS